MLILKLSGQIFPKRTLISSMFPAQEIIELFAIRYNAPFRGNKETEEGEVN